MDYSLLALIGMIVVAMIISTRFHSRSWPGRPGWQYQRVLSVGFFGLLLFVSGLIGLDLRRSGGWFNGAEWADGPIWSQAAIGAAMLLLAAFWARRVPPRYQATAHRQPMALTRAAELDGRSDARRRPTPR